MARRLFFSFHYDRDVWRANVVRNSWLTHPAREVAGFWDASLWETAKRHGDQAVKRLIDRGLQNTSVTAVLIGAQTAGRKWVLYEIEESFKRDNGLLGIYIHNIRDRSGYTDGPGLNPFDKVWVDHGLRRTYFSEVYPCYDWVLDRGYNNLGSWVEAAAKNARR